MQQIATSAKIPVLDTGVVRKLSKGAIKVVPGMFAIDEDNVIFNDGSKGKFDLVIFATGYRRNYRSFLETDEITALDKSMPHGQSHDLMIYFVAFRNTVTGLLREISKEAVEIADKIVRQRNRPVGR